MHVFAPFFACFACQKTLSGVIFQRLFLASYQGLASAKPQPARPFLEIRFAAKPRSNLAAVVFPWVLGHVQAIFYRLPLPL
jgi:hypothetical protein